MKIKLNYGKSFCPTCDSESGVYIYDKGLNFWRRLIVGNNRLACRNCEVTWRRNDPDSQTKLRKKDTIATHTENKSSPLRIDISFFLKAIKDFWTYCIIGVLSAICAYLLFSGFSFDFQKLTPRQKIETQNVGNTKGNNASLRNDKIAGKQELLNRRGRKNY